MEISSDIKDAIKQNMLHITLQIKKKPRNYLNKQLQDAVCNYFLENYAAPFLKQDFQVNSGRALRKRFESALPKGGKKYINLLNKFKTEIIRVGKGAEYRRMLVEMVYEKETLEFASSEWCTLQRKKILALLLIIHWDQENILNFYDMWNVLYPNDPMIKHKMSIQEKEKKEREKALFDDCGSVSLSIPQQIKGTIQIPFEGSSTISLAHMTILNVGDQDTSKINLGTFKSDQSSFEEQNEKLRVTNQETKKSNIMLNSRISYEQYQQSSSETDEAYFNEEPLRKIMKIEKDSFLEGVQPTPTPYLFLNAESKEDFPYYEFDAYLTSNRNSISSLEENLFQEPSKQIRRSYSVTSLEDDNISLQLDGSDEHLQEIKETFHYLDTYQNGQSLKGFQEDAPYSVSRADSYFDYFPNY